MSYIGTLLNSAYLMTHGVPEAGEHRVLGEAAEHRALQASRHRPGLLLELDQTLFVEAGCLAPHLFTET